MNCWLAASIFLTIIGSIRCTNSGEEGTSRSVNPLTDEELEERRQQMQTYASLVENMLEKVDSKCGTTFQQGYKDKHTQWLSPEQKNLTDFGSETPKLLKEVMGEVVKKEGTAAALTYLVKLCGKMKKNGVWIPPFNENVEQLYVNDLEGDKKVFEIMCEYFKNEAQELQ